MPLVFEGFPAQLTGEGHPVFQSVMFDGGPHLRCVGRVRIRRTKQYRAPRQVRQLAKRLDEHCLLLVGQQR